MMSLPSIIQEAIRGIHEQSSLINKLLIGALQWPIEEKVESIEDISYNWTADDLSAGDIDKKVVDGQIWQIQPLVSNQPWGIFLLDFRYPDVFLKGRGLSGLLRKVLRGLVPNRRKAASVPSWKSDNILFICMHNWQHYRFAYFRSGETDKLPRLATFGWGPESSSRTACEFNLPSLVWPENADNKEGWVRAWAKAFDKEELTKQFYKTFAELYEQVKEEIALAPAHHVRAQEHAQMLLDRLLFLSFLQKKRWLNNEPDYLYRRLKEHQTKEPESFSYYQHVLYPLFEALSNRAKRPSSIGQVPFLNGGLFNLEWGAVDMQVHLKIKNSMFSRIFDSLLNKYNFTVMEDTPLNREVAVDPEMLGKVFETVVLVSDTGGDFQAPDLRKATGSFYTPRIVVHFICREVLLKYLSARLGGEVWEARIKRLLDIDASDGLDKDDLKTLREIFSPEEAASLRKIMEKLKCCDPSVGSGAFAVGLLQEILNLMLLCEACERGKDPRLDKGANYLYEKKLQIIENSIYGVDIQAKAVDICKLRLWLSLVVDYELEVDPDECTAEKFEEAIASIPPLPNLAYKIRQGDALLDQIHGVPFRLDKVPVDSDMAKIIEQLKTEHQKFFKEEDPVKKRHIRKTVLGLRLKLSRKQFLAELEHNLPIVQEGLFGDSAKTAEMRRWREAEEAKIKKALKEVDQIESQLAFFKSKSRLSQEDEDRLAYLENGGDRDITFAWRLDFPEVFNRIQKAPSTLRGRLALTGGSGQQELVEDVVVDDGFDIMVGNPPFVTARNEEKRELYRERWQPYCYMKYHLLVPFFPRSFGVMADDAQLGFIVSNAFAKREFGKPLIEQFFPKVEINKIVDCSGLMFPGHGTPTCIIHGRNRKPAEDSKIRVAAILPGGGDLRTAPEDSPLWATLEVHHNDAGYSDSKIIVADRSRADMSKWPWNFDVGAEPTKLIIENTNSPLTDYLLSGIGFDIITGSDEFFVHSSDYFRRINISTEILLPYVNGEDIRDWEINPELTAIFPYKDKSVITPSGGFLKYAENFKKHLKDRLCFGKTAEERGLKWWEYAMVMWTKRELSSRIGYCFIATHNHFILPRIVQLLKQGAPIIKIKNEHSLELYELLISLLNSSSILFWLKIGCFSKREAEEAERGTFYEFAGGKLEQLPVPNSVAKALEGEDNALARRLTKLSHACSEHGQVLPSLAIKKLFDKKGEAYDSWNRFLTGYVAPHPLIADPFTDAASLHGAFAKTVSERELLRTEMIALQEEMDWLVYQAYGLIEKNAQCTMESDDIPERLLIGQRPFELWAAADKEFGKACELIPGEWTVERRELWKRRLEAIRDNEHIRRIEQPVYKRRWYQSDSYEKQFKKAFEWWLLEKAEWWLEHKKSGGPVSLDIWAAALWKDDRMQAASAIVENSHPTFPSFIKLFKAVINSETVPEGIPFAKPWPELEAKGKGKVPAKVKNIRGKLNVPRERFRLRGKDAYLWAGLEWQNHSAPKVAEETSTYEPVQNISTKRAGTSPAPTKTTRKDSGQAGMTQMGKDDWQTWLALSQWAKQTTSINTFWGDFALEISNILKAGKQPTDKQKENMKKCWNVAVKKGFKL